LRRALAAWRLVAGARAAAGRGASAATAQRRAEAVAARRFAGRLLCAWRDAAFDAAMRRFQARAPGACDPLCVQATGSSLAAVIRVGSLLFCARAVVLLCKFDE